MELDNAMSGLDAFVESQMVDIQGGDANEPTNQQTTVDVPDDVAGSYVAETNNEPNQNDDGDNNQVNNTGDYMSSFLGLYGIKDGKILYQDDDGKEEEKDFNSLDDKEKLNVLKSLTSSGLTKEEQETINFLRSQRVSLEQLLNEAQKQAIEEYKQKNVSQKTYAIDDYTDEELYAGDLKSRIPDITDEEINAEIEALKENEELFKKKVNSLRQQYKDTQDQVDLEREAEKQERLKRYDDQIVEALNNFNSLDFDYKDTSKDATAMEIPMDQKEAVYQYIMATDANGESEFFKELRDPRVVTELAWYALFGRDAISDITNYWKSQLKSTRRAENKAQTTVVPKKDTLKKDDFFIRRNSVDTSFGDDLL